jgi:osmotically-inducible protein OsmY
MRKLLGLIGLGAALSYFFDPQNGRRRRAMASDRFAAFFRHRARRAEQLGRAVSSQAEGVVQKANLEEEPKPQPDDVTLARKVESELFRDPVVPKGQINIDAANGKVYLRGEVGQPELIRDLEKRTRNVQGVQDVENLLHLPGAETPTKS